VLGLTVTDTLYRRAFPSSFEQLGEVLPEALDALEKAGWLAQENKHCLRLCLEEGLVNAITHGNRGDASRMVHIAIAEENGGLTISIRDEGGGFDPSLVPEPEPAQLGGRGVCLLRHYMDSVEYDMATGCLRMSLRQSMPAPKE
jgi:anti-sigma regulatory factor (Ser/Thr protein kinase)